MKKFSGLSDHLQSQHYLLFLIHAVVRSVFFSRLSALAETYSFAIFGFSLGWCELQMCMAFCIGYIELEYGNDLI